MSERSTVSYLCLISILTPGRLLDDGVSLCFGEHSRDNRSRLDWPGHLQCQDVEGWGSGVIARLAEDLGAEFRNEGPVPKPSLLYAGLCLRLAGANCPTARWTIGVGPHHRAAGQARDSRIKKLVRRSGRGVRVVVQRAAEYGYGPGDGRTGSAPSNFAEVLPAPVSELAQQAAKDPYNFEFLGLTGEVAELTASEIDKG